MYNKTKIIVLVLVALLINSAQADLVQYLTFDIDGSAAVGYDAVLIGDGATISASDQGKFGSALQLTGSNSYAIIQGYKGIAGSSARTVTMWVKVQANQPSNNPTLISWGSAANGQRFDIRPEPAVTNNGTTRIEVQGGFSTGSTKINDGQWHHIAVTYDGGTVGNVKIYVDGVLDSLTAAGSMAINTGNSFDVIIGSSFHDNYSRCFAGLIDELRIYNTALTAEQVYLDAFGLQPLVHSPEPSNVSTGIDPQATLNWSFVGADNPVFAINIGTDESCNDILNQYNLGSATSYSIPFGLLDFGSTYYWRIDMTDGDQAVSSAVWSFTTGGKAFEPLPSDGKYANWDNPYLNWQSDIFADNFDVYFGDAVDNMIFIDNSSQNQISLALIAEVFAIPRLEQGSYYWRVDTRNADGQILCSGDIWSIFVPEYIPVGYMILEDFSAYSSWHTIGDIIIELDDLLNRMLLYYSGSGQVIFDYIDPVDFTLDDMAEIEINFYGQSTNEPIELSLILNDGINQGQMQFTYEAGINDGWQNLWVIKLSEFSRQGVDIAAIQSIALQTTGTGTGLFYIIDFMLYENRSSIPADINQDNNVDIADLALLVADWLNVSQQINASDPGLAWLKAHYTFENNLDDVSGNNNNAILKSGSVEWIADAAQGDYAITIDADTIIELPVNLFDDIANEFTLAFWARGYLDAGCADFIIGESFAGSPADRVDWMIDDYAAYNQWNHYCFVKNTNNQTMKIYCNGILIAKNNNAASVFDSHTDDISLTVFGDNAISIDDLRIYSRALDHSQIVFLVSGVAGTITQPLWLFDSKADINADGIVNLEDWYIIGNNWLWLSLL